MNGRRFSDEELAAMHHDLKTIIKRFDTHEETEARKFSEMICAIADNTKSVNRLATSVEPMLDLQRDLQGTAKIGKSVQAFLLWLLKWGAIGAGIATAVKYILSIGAKL